MKTVLEVGANKGTDTARWLRDRDNLVYAFEPTPELCTELWNKFSHDENFFLIPAAVDIENAWKIFNVAGQKDWGCSSLHEFSDDLNVTWPNRSDFKVTKKINVMCTRLDTFIKNYNIGTIDYLWIDAQGNDFNVLKSLGKYIKNVQSGKCEVSYTVELYKNTDNTINSVKPWLESNGFTVTVTPDKTGKECDLHFKR